MDNLMRMANKKENAAVEMGTVKVTRKTAKMLLMLATWDGTTVAEYCEKTLDPILEERLASAVESVHKVRPKRE